MRSYPLWGMFVDAGIWLSNPYTIAYGLLVVNTLWCWLQHDLVQLLYPLAHSLCAAPVQVRSQELGSVPSLTVQAGLAQVWQVL